MAGFNIEQQPRHNDGDEDDDIKVHRDSSCMTTVIKCWEEDFQGNVRKTLPMTGTMIALVVTSEQRIPS